MAAKDGSKNSVIASAAKQSRICVPHPEERGTRVSKDGGPAGGLALRDAREVRAPQGEGLPDCLARTDERLLPPAPGQQKHALLAEQIPHPPRHPQPQRAAVEIERFGALHL